MKKNSIIIISCIFFIFSCAKHKETDPLLLPPDFELLPDLNQEDEKPSKVNDQDINNLKNLLLK